MFITPVFIPQPTIAVKVIVGPRLRNQNAGVDGPMQLVIDSWKHGDSRRYDFYYEDPAEYMRGYFGGTYIAENVPEEYADVIRVAIEQKFFELHPTGDIVYARS